MNQTPLWFERKFEFSFPVELHPNLCARLRGTPARLEETVLGKAPAILIRRPGDKWSAQEHAGHLLDLESLWMARINDYLTDAPKLITADLSNRKTHEGRHNQRPIKEILADFRNARSCLVRSAENIHSEVFARAIPHPRLQTLMRLVDHLYFVAEHDDHHLAHIWELINTGDAAR
jgi:DinB superfamily